MPARIVGTIKDEGYYNLQEAAAYLGMSNATIKHHVYTTQAIGVIKVNGKAVVISKDALDNFNQSGVRREITGHHSKANAKYDNVEISDEAMGEINRLGLNVEDVERRCSQLGVLSVRANHIREYFGEG